MTCHDCKPFVARILHLAKLRTKIAVLLTKRNVVKYNMMTLVCA